MIVVVEKRNSETVTVDIAVPGDFRMKIKEAEIIDKYQSLAKGNERMCKTNGKYTKVVPLVVSFLRFASLEIGRRYNIISRRAFWGDT